jgi:hypothetical protein
MYRIAWLNKLNGEKGAGEFVLSFDLADIWLTTLDKKFKYIHHWIERLAN